MAAPSRAAREGVSRSSRHVVRGAMDAGGFARRARPACGRRRRVVLISRRWDQVRKFDLRTTEAIKPVLRGERAIGRNTVVQGMPDRFGVPVVTNSRTFALCARLRVPPASGIPCALRFRACDGWQDSGRSCRENAKPRLSSSLRANGSRECAPDDRLREAIHLAARGNMDCLVASLLAMTALFENRIKTRCNRRQSRSSPRCDRTTPCS